MECAICLDRLSLHDPSTTPCGHTFHREPCLRELLRAARPECPLCRAALPRDLPAPNVALREALAQAEAPPARAPLRAVDAALLVTLPAPLLGEGSYGRVHYGSYDGAEVAVKVLQLDARDAAPEVVAGFRREAKLLCDLSHPNILHMYGVMEGGGAGVGGGGGGGGRLPVALSLVIRLAEGGSLAEALHGGPLPSAASRRVALGVARALAYLHSRHPPVAHNDLKSGNVLLDGEGNALLADFGVSRAVGGSLTHTHGAATARGERGAVGTVAWMAPENGDPEDANYLKPGADVYSFGMLLFELITGSPPWQGLNTGQIFAAVRRGVRPPLPAGADAELAGLITACWAANPAARPTAAAAVARLAAMEWGRGGGKRAAPGAAWTQRLREARAAARRDPPAPAARVRGGGAAARPAAMPPAPRAAAEPRRSPWACSACTLENLPDALACKLCLMLRGPAPPPPRAAAPSPPRAAAPSPPRAAAPAPQELPAAAKGAERVVALMRAGAVRAGAADAGAPFPIAAAPPPPRAAAPLPPRSAAPSPPRAAALALRELPSAAMGATRVVALLRVGAADAGVVRAGAEALIELTGGRGIKEDRAAVLRRLGVDDFDARCNECIDAAPVLVRALKAGGADAASVFCVALRNIATSIAGRAACVAARAPAAVVAALTTHAGVAAVCENTCWALVLITADNDAGCADCITAGAPAAVVAALTTHAGVAAVCEWGCRALACIANSDSRRAACVAAGAPAAVVAALTTHAGSSDVCLRASWALLAIAWSGPTHRAAVVAARAVAPLAAALARHPSVRETAHAVLERLGYTDAGVKK
jgi:serine/threonine protein kinase